MASYVRRNVPDRDSIVLTHGRSGNATRMFSPRAGSGSLCRLAAREAAHAVISIAAPIARHNSIVLATHASRTTIEAIGEIVFDDRPLVHSGCCHEETRIQPPALAFVTKRRGRVVVTRQP